MLSLVSLSLLPLLTCALATPLSGNDTASHADNFRTWATASAMATDFVSRLNLTEKSAMLTGKLSLGTGGCIGNILPINRIGYSGLCLQDGGNGVNLADLTTVFPSGVTVGASWDKKLMYERAVAMGEEFRSKGIHVALGPSAGPLGRHALGGRNWEGFSVDPYLSGIAIAATIEGIQSQGVQACAKHIVGNEQETQRSFTISANGTRIEAISSNIDDRTMHELYIWPFANAIKAGVASAMCSYNRLNQTYACENSALLNNILKVELGFQGYIMSDWFATHSGAKSINAGLDLNMPGAYSVETTATGESYWGANITTMVQAGSVSEERIDEMVRRIMIPYFFFGQDRDDYPPVDPSLAYSFAAWSNVLDYLPKPIPNSRDVRGNHHRLVRKIGAESSVLLKNVDSTLPLKAPLNIGVFGNDAADPSDGLTFNERFEIGTLDIGAGAASVRHTYLVSPLEAIKARAKIFGGRVQHILRNSIIAAGDFSSLFPIPDVCLVFLNTFASENMDRQTYEADWNSTLVVENVARICPKTVVITHSAGINSMPWANNVNVTAIIAAHLPGQESGNSIVDVLWGDVNPSGKLPYSIAKNPEDYDIPIVNLTEAQGNSPTGWQSDFVEGQMIDYRQLDFAGIEPLFEFGFGLSYTTFSMNSELKVKELSRKLTSKPDSSREIRPGGNLDLWVPVLQVSTSVTNTGSKAGSTVPQLYVSLPLETTPQGTPVQVLRGFEKLALKPGETRKITFELLRRDVSYWDTSSQTWVIPRGKFSFKAGFSSRDIVAKAEMELDLRD
ncbi:beta-glucosidase [Aspergillus novofumigatus IBT 16806]|uniref:Probable beta-glucosidase G n=1 Tax=Aspergillus novofumigatus (strain IBT 16806) TaxID=1392255 RepID=A0A2I1CC37_ASPN1|nr:glycosyl hydrolase family 3 N terminal domain-containing protein [Aspergillus novofumigatus IBT 16806]PKX95161.1 glycosyl hydrolase family 3 N terminal domain-containing protein [Aspergillus novofumigatus IBT 16806]